MGGRVLHLTETSSSAHGSSSLTNFSVTSMTMTLCYHLGGLFHRLPLLDVLHDQLVKHLLLDVLHDHLVKHLLLPILVVLLAVSRKSQEKCTKKRRKKLGVAVVLLANVFFGGWEMSEFGGGEIMVGRCKIIGPKMFKILSCCPF